MSVRLVHRVDVDAHSLLTDLVDLALGRACIDCDRPGRVLCDTCLRRLRAQDLLTDGPPGLPPIAAALAYEGSPASGSDGRRLVLAYKEDGIRALAPMLGVLLADAVRAQLAELACRRCLLVPVPGHRRARRGFDALGDVVRWAQRDLVRHGSETEIVRPLRAAAAYRPLKELSRDERRDAVANAFAVAGDHVMGLRRPRAPVLVVDDVVTTGATVGEVVRVLADARIRTHGIAAIALANRDTSAPIRARARPTFPR